MDRRAFVRTVGSGVVFVGAGCLTRQNSAKPDQQTNTNNDDCPTNEPVLTTHSFDVVSAKCGTGENESRASFETNRLRVSGTITGADSCYTAKLQAFTHENNTLTVVIQSYKRDDTGICSTCVTDIEYDATFEFDNGLPQRVVVVHNDTEVLDKQHPTTTTPPQ